MLINEVIAENISRRGILKGIAAGGLIGPSIAKAGSSRKLFKDLTNEERNIVLRVVWSWLYTIDKDPLPGVPSTVRLNPIAFTDELSRFTSVYKGSKDWLIEYIKFAITIVKKNKAEMDPVARYNDVRNYILNAQDYLDDLKELNNVGEQLVLQPQGQETQSKDEVINGFVVAFSPKYLANTDYKLKQRFKVHLKDQITKALEVLPTSLHQLLTKCGIYVDENPEVNFYLAFLPKGIQGFPVESVNGLYVPNWKKIDNHSPHVFVHELSHYYYDNGLSSDKKDFIKNVYNSAMSKGLYKNQHAAKNHYEYHGVLSQIYFGNDYELVPHDREELLKYDLDGYNMIEKVWEVA
jgi:hypothetical protein